LTSSLLGYQDPPIKRHPSSMNRRDAENKPEIVPVYNDSTRNRVGSKENMGLNKEMLNSLKIGGNEKREIMFSNILKYPQKMHKKLILDEIPINNFMQMPNFGPRPESQNRPERTVQVLKKVEGEENQQNHLHRIQVKCLSEQNEKIRPSTGVAGGNQRSRTPVVVREECLNEVKLDSVKAGKTADNKGQVRARPKSTKRALQESVQFQVNTALLPQKKKSKSPDKKGKIRDRLFTGMMDSKFEGWTNENDNFLDF